MRREAPKVEDKTGQDVRGKAGKIRQRRGTGMRPPSLSARRTEYSKVNLISDRAFFLMSYNRPAMITQLVNRPTGNEIETFFFFKIMNHRDLNCLLVPTHTRDEQGFDSFDHVMSEYVLNC